MALIVIVRVSKEVSRLSWYMCFQIFTGKNGASNPSWNKSTFNQRIHSMCWGMWSTEHYTIAKMESSAKKYVSGRDHLDGRVEQSSQRICCDRSATRADCWIWLIRICFVRSSVKKPPCSARSRMAPGKSGIYFGRMLNLLVSKFRPRIERDFLSNNPQPIEITAFLRRIYFGRACHKKST